MEKNSDTRHVNHQGFPLDPDTKISFFHWLMRGRIGMIVFLLLTIILTMFPAIFLSWAVFVCMLSGLVSKDACRRFVNWAFGVWLYMESYFLDKILGTHIRVFGHSKEFSDRSLFIMNHRCHFDWMFFFSVICKQGDPKKWIAILKAVGKSFPVLGWLMQIRNFIFMSRNWSKDERELKLKLNYLKATNSKYQLVLFPEGTDLQAKSIIRSDKFAKDNNYPIYDYVLHPKTTGFKYVLNTLREHKIDTVYDITVGYPDLFAPTEKELVLEGRIPREIHYHVRSYDASSLPVTDVELDKWIRERWAEKEQRLRVFYTHKRFYELSFDNRVDCHINNDSCDSATAPLVDLTMSPEVQKKLLISDVFLSITFCVVNLFLFGYLCWVYWYVATLAAMLVAGIIYVSIYTEGADYMVMNSLDNKEFQRLFKKIGMTT